MSDTPQAEPAHTRRSTRPALAPESPSPARALTRAELRRRAQAGETSRTADAATIAVPAPVSAATARRRARADETEPVVAAPVLAQLDEADPVSDIAALADLEPEALVVPELIAKPATVTIEVPHPASATGVPVAEASVAASAEPSPVTLATAPVALVAPTRRARVRPPRTVDEPEPFELVRPVDAAVAADEPIAVAAAAADSAPAENAASAENAAPTQEAVDEFEAAMRLFAFTQKSPAQVAASGADDETVAVPDAPAAHGRRRALSFKRVAAASFSAGVVGVVGLLAVGMTTPVGAVAAAQGKDASAMNIVAADDASRGEEKIQAYVAPAQVHGGVIERSDAFQTSTLAEIAAESGIRNFSSFFVNDPTAAIQWPFAVGVPITYGFGMRPGGMHEGADFVPGAGSPVQAIADGTVRIATESGAAFGVTVLIDHVIDGERVSSRYAHMQHGSLTVSPGDVVTVGTVIGKTGDTGRSYGAHTHVEILAGGTTPIDPIPWLRSHAGG